MDDQWGPDWICTLTQQIGTVKKSDKSKMK